MSTELSPETIKKIQEIATGLAKRYTFPNYDKDDIEQEAFIIGLESMARYDPDRPLENFLRVHMKNRLLNLRRDKYYRSENGNAEKIQQKKKKLLDASPFDNLSFAFSSLDPNNLESKELLEFIDKNLDSLYRADYLRFIDGKRLTKAKRLRLFNQLKDIMVEYYENGSPVE